MRQSKWHVQLYFRFRWMILQCLKSLFWQIWCREKQKGNWFSKIILNAYNCNWTMNTFYCSRKTTYWPFLTTVEHKVYCTLITPPACQCWASSRQAHTVAPEITPCYCFWMLSGSKWRQLINRSENVPVVLSTLWIYRAYTKWTEGPVYLCADAELGPSSWFAL